MAANTNPIYTGKGAVGPVAITAANTNSQGTGTIGTDIFKAYTIDATNGSFISDIVFQPTASAAGTNTAATVLRAFLSTKTSGATVGGTDTWLLGEVTAGVQSADNATASTFPWVLTLNRAIPPGTYTILVSSHAAPAASTNWQATVFGGDYTA